MSKIKPIPDPLVIGEILRGRQDSGKYVLMAIQAGYWGDGATGYQLSKRVYVGGSLVFDYLAEFWVRPEELVSMYRRAYDRPMLQD